MLNLKCQIFGILLYLVSNLTLTIACVKFGISMKNTFYVKIQILSIDTKIWYCIEDGLTISIKILQQNSYPDNKLNSGFCQTITQIIII